MFHWPLAHGTQRQRLASEGETMGTTDSICGLYDALMAVAAAATAGDPVIALAALDSLDAESAVMRGLLTVAADTAGHEPLDGVCGPIHGGQRPVKIASPEMGHTPGDHRVNGGGCH
jgi:hypothetical protein